MRFLRFFSLLTALLLLLASCGSKKRALSNTQIAKRAQAERYQPEKYELRAVWIPTVFRTEYTALTTQEVQQNLIKKLDLIQKTGFNAVIFQVRSEADAWYYSPYEPWSRFLTGEQGRAPYPLWDPLQFLVEECHKRNLELHAWINPYRAVTSMGSQLAPNHPYFNHPEWFVPYGNQLLFNPANPEVRDYVCGIVQDIVERYDVDAIHLDDYFYPYPVAGQIFPDQEDFMRNPSGFQNIGDWRREQVNLMVKQLHHSIKSIKPHVRLGISPFGIYRNEKSDPKGSKTNGLQNYDDLFADVLYWDRMNWVDYIMPQIYWQIGNKAAEYTELAYWWQRNIHNAQYFIGQDIRRTMDRNELHTKMNITHQTAEGQCFWPGEDIFTNYSGITDQLRSTYWSKPALIPPTPYPSGLRTFDEPHRDAFISKANGVQELVWEPDIPYPRGQETKFFVVYCHPRNTKLPKAISQEFLLDQTRDNHLQLVNLGGKQKVAFTITRVNRFNHEIVIAHNIPAKL